MRKYPIKILAALVGLATLLAGCGANSSDDSKDRQVSMITSPALHGSFGPNLASAPDGRIVLSWLQPTDDDQHALNYAVLVESGWGAVSTAASGPGWFANWADFPSVVPVTDTLWGAHWLVRRSAGGYAYDIYAAISTDSGQTWSESFNPHSDDTDTEHGFVSMFPDGDRIGMVWLDGRKFVNEVTDDVAASGMTLRSASFAEDLVGSNDTVVDDLICDCCQTDVTVTTNGPVAVYRNRTQDEIRDIYVARQVDGRWQQGVAVSDDNWEIPGCPVNGPVINSRGSQVAVAWFSAPNENSRIQAAWSDDAGLSFGPAVEVSADKPTGHVGAVLLDNGDLVVSWQRRVGDGGAELNLRRVSPNGEMGSIRVIDEAAEMFAISVPQLVRHGEDMVLAWTIKENDAYGVRTAVVPTNYLD